MAATEPQRTDDKLLLASHHSQASVQPHSARWWRASETLTPRIGRFTIIDTGTNAASRRRQPIRPTSATRLGLDRPGQHHGVELVEAAASAGSRCYCLMRTLASRLEPRDVDRAQTSGLAIQCHVLDHRCQPTGGDDHRHRPAGTHPAHAPGRRCRAIRPAWVSEVLASPVGCPDSPPSRHQRSCSSSAGLPEEASRIGRVADQQRDGDR